MVIARGGAVAVDPVVHIAYGVGILRVVGRIDRIGSPPLPLDDPAERHRVIPVVRRTRHRDLDERSERPRGERSVHGIGALSLEVDRADKKGVRLVVARVRIVAVRDLPRRIIRRDLEYAVERGGSGPFIQTGRILAMKPEGVAVDDDELEVSNLAVGVPSPPVKMHLVSGGGSFDGAARKPHFGTSILGAHADHHILGASEQGDEDRKRRSREQAGPDFRIHSGTSPMRGVSLITHVRYSEI
jgi:hypothetical protein